MTKVQTPGTWEPRLDGKVWKVYDDNGNLVATLKEGPEAGKRAQIIAMSPNRLEAFKLWLK